MSVVELGIDAIERGLVPDSLTRMAIRRLCKQRLTQQESSDQLDSAIFAALSSGEIAQVPEKANEQHYEVSSDFFCRVLGPRLKYSSCYFPDDRTSLADAEEAALQVTCERAQLVDGQQILELGCGWGSLSLWMAEHFPNSRIVAVSNSNSQRKFIQAKCESLGLKNLEVITSDINAFETSRQFDRVVSVEMFEHMRNYEKLLHQIAGWLKPGGRLFVHIFCHSKHCYPFETEGATNWMGRHFFSGGIMPSEDIFDHFPNDLIVDQQFRWNGAHYEKTLNCWLEKMDSGRDELMEVIGGVYGIENANRWFNRWRMFFMASAELFGFDGGDEWFVSHYLLRHK